MPASAPPALAALLRAVGRRVADARRSRGLTQEQLAARLGIASKNLQRIEHGRQNLTLGTLLTLAQSLDTEPVSLLPGATGSAQGPSSPGDLLRAHGWRFVEGEALQPGVVPVMVLGAQAGGVGETRVPAVLGGVHLPAALRQRSGVQGFVTRVEGRSMEPRVPAGAWCLFRAPVEGPLEGRVLLLELRDVADPDAAGAYTLKRFAGMVVLQEVPVVRLVSTNPEVAAMELAVDVFATVRVVGELLEVLTAQVAPAQTTSSISPPTRAPSG